MSYLNGKDILPAELLKEVQRYVQGKSIYIPRADRAPAAIRGRAADISSRNSAICARFAEGISARQLAEEYFLSMQAVYKILAADRK